MNWQSLNFKIQFEFYWLVNQLLGFEISEEKVEKLIVKIVIAVLQIMAFTYY